MVDDSAGPGVPVEPAPIGHNNPPDETPDARAHVSAATYTVEEAGKLLGIGRNQTYEAVHRGDLPYIRIGKRLLIPKAVLDRLLNGEKAACER